MVCDYVSCPSASHLLFYKIQSEAFRRRSLPQLSGTINFLACDKCKIYCTNVTIKSRQTTRNVSPWPYFRAEEERGHLWPSMSILSKIGILINHTQVLERGIGDYFDLLVHFAVLLYFIIHLKYF